MALSRPYQPSLLRLLHAIVAVMVPLAWVSGLVLFGNHDRRWWPLIWSVPGNWIDLHGSIGVMLWPAAALLTLYALTVGRHRLSRPANAAALAALVLAVGTGKLMNEDWLRTGQLDHPVYTLHLSAWLVLTASVLWHVTAVLQRGGKALASSMAHWEVRPHDHPRAWLQQLGRGLKL